MSLNTQKAKHISKQRFNAGYSLGISSSKNYQIIQDAQLLAQHIITYMQSKNPDYQFTDFYQPNLVKTLRLLIKNQKMFLAFLNTISFSVEDFFQIGVYVIPHVFTSHLIRFIKVTYFGADPNLIKPRKRKSKKETIEEDIIDDIEDIEENED